MAKYSIGVDFGTLSARAVLVNIENGDIIAESEMAYPHKVMDRTISDEIIVEKNSAFQHPQDYLDCLSYTVNNVISNINSDDVLGIGIDFTSCTMLPVDESGTPMCLKKEYENEPNSYVKLWKHHSAQAEADFITEKAIISNEEWLKNYGGKVSSEWLFPKILETLNNAPRLYKETARFIEAADWIVWMLTGNEVHSSCMAGYKGMWNKNTGYPKKEFLEKIAPEFKDIIGTKLSENIKPPGTKAGVINEYGAKITGLKCGTTVAVPIIDAHATLPAAGIVNENQLMLIIGTSACQIVMSKQSKNVPCICGSVQDGIIPGFVAYEAGQACVGDSFDWFIKNCVPRHYYEETKSNLKSIFDILTEKAENLEVGENRLLALDWWNGNRTPYADFDLSGTIVGLNMLTKPEDIYRALIESTAYGTRSILELYERSGVLIDKVYATGGISQKNTFLMQIYADVLGKTIIVPQNKQAAAKGSSILAAYASGFYNSIDKASAVMADKDVISYTPNISNNKKYEVLYKIYQELSVFFGKTNTNLMKTLKNILPDS